MRMQVLITNLLVRTIPAETQKTKTIVAGKIIVILVPTQRKIEMQKKSTAIPRMATTVMVMDRLKIVI